MSEFREKESQRKHASSLTMGLIVALILVIFAIGVAVAILSSPEPTVMAPGQNFYTQEPRENI